MWLSAQFITHHGASKLVVGQEVSNAVEVLKRMRRSWHAKCLFASRRRIAHITLPM